MSAFEASVPYTTYKTSTGDISVSVQGIGQHYVWSSKKRVLAFSLTGGVLLGLLVGLLIGFLTKSSLGDSDTSRTPSQPSERPLPSFTRSFDFGDLQDALSFVNGLKMASFVREYFQGQLLLPASEDSRRKALQLTKLWLSLGIKASNVSKIVLISRPEQRSIVTILNSTWTTTYAPCINSTSNGNSMSISAASVAYAPAGYVQGSLVYANYGRTIDFNTIARPSGNSSTVAIIQYGKINVNDKLRNAATWGASAVILYHDRNDGLDPCIPAYASAKSILGDPGTPSIGILSDTTYNIDSAEASRQFGGAVPAVSVSSAAAAQLLFPFMNASQQGGSWTTLGSNITPSTGAVDRSYLVSLNSTRGSETTREEMGMVFGAITGTVDSDRMIFVGAHHDALDNRTTLDAGTGAAIQDELIRILVQKGKAGWRPRRSIVFGSFDATTLQIGSREWTESNTFEFLSRGVAYLHLGASVTGPDFVAASSVALASLLVEATGNLSASADGSSRTLLDQWRLQSGSSNYSILSGRGDHSSFTAYLGIPAIQMRFTSISEKPWPQSVACCRQQLTSDVAGPSQLAKLTEAYLSVLLRLSDSAILPYDPSEIADAIERGIMAVNNSMDVLAANDISLAGLWAGSRSAITKLRDMNSNQLRNATLNARRLGNDKVRRISDLLLTLTRMFIHPSGVPTIKDNQVVTNINNRNMLIGPLSDDENSMQEFPGIFDLLKRATLPEHWKALRRHVAEVTLAMDGAVSCMTRGLGDNMVWIPDF